MTGIGVLRGLEQKSQLLYIFKPYTYRDGCVLLQWSMKDVNAVLEL